MKETVCSVALFLVGAVFYVLSIRSFLQKGFPLNNSYIYASEAERRYMDKKPLFRQTGIVFLLIGSVFALNGIALLTGFEWLYGAAVAVLIGVIVYAVVSSLKM